MALFGRKNEKHSNERIFLLMDRNSRMIARGRQRNVPGTQNLIISLLEGDAGQVAAAGVVQAVPQDKSQPPQMTRVIDRRGDTVMLEPMRELGAEVRRNFRVPVAFDSFLYPAGGGRAALRSVDLSCGGIAFLSNMSLAVGDEFEVVVPITAEGPLLLTAHLLRVHLEPGRGNFYACKFIDMIDDEETMLREAVFAIQIHTARARAR